MCLSMSSVDQKCWSELLLRTVDEKSGSEVLLISVNQKCGSAVLLKLSVRSVNPKCRRVAQKCRSEEVWVRSVDQVSLKSVAQKCQ